MAERMLKFVGTPQAMPDKRPAAERRRDFDEIYERYAGTRQPNRPPAARNAACPSVRCTARCTTTSPTG